MTLIAEGDKLYNNGPADKALEFYNQALEIFPEDKHGLVARSKCYLTMCNIDAALRDAEKSLKSDKNFHRGLEQKAETLYQMGDFEMALVFFHRGHKLRPELNVFTLGIQKTQEAIINSVGASTRLQIEQSMANQNNKDSRISGKQSRKPKSAPGVKKSESQTKASVQKKLLAELYVDKEFLENLENDHDLMKSCISEKAHLHVHDLVTDGIDYLSNRAQFWRQRKPIYARQTNTTNVTPMSDPLVDFMVSINKIEKTDNFKEAMAIAEKEIQKIERCTEKQLQLSGIKQGSSAKVSKQHLISEICMTAGNWALIEYQDKKVDKVFVKAEENFKKVIKLGAKQKDKSKSKDYQSSALERLGRLYVIKGDITNAINTWEQRESLIYDQKEELVVLYHDLGRAYLSKGNTDKALENANHSFSNVRDQGWKMNVMVLLAEIHLAKNEVKQAKMKLENCLTIARSENDTSAEKAVLDLLSRLRA